MLDNNDIISTEIDFGGYSMSKTEIRYYSGYIRNFKSLCDQLGIEQNLSREARENAILRIDDEVAVVPVVMERTDGGVPHALLL